MIGNIDKLVQLAQIRGGVNVQCHFQGKWAVQHHDHANQAVVHIVTEGCGWLKLENGESRQLQKGDIVLLSRSAAHQLSSSKDVNPFPSSPDIEQKGGIQIRKIFNGQGNELKLFCAHFYYEPHSDLFMNLPDCIYIHLSDQILQPILNLLHQEVDKAEQISQLAIDSLSNVLLIHLLRNYLIQKPEAVSGILKSIQDHRLSTLVSQIISCPEQDWTIEKMVEISHISRAQLMRIFKQKIGITPHAFVHNIRLQLAAMMLKNSSSSVLTIALSCGFLSETHFSKAFKNLYGTTPSRYRRNGID
ncbi:MULTISPECIES: AraC family transcriptional regulator [unclassified Mannheimia]|uniref:AraC family transcriptional regulator n=1 Tax=unclassified Mannheimia TaxID=2645054 RepID=UPI00359D8738